MLLSFMRVDTETRRNDSISGKARKRVTKLPCREHLIFLLGRCLSPSFLYPGFFSGNQLLAQSRSRRVSSADRGACDLGWPIRALPSSDMAAHTGGRGAACRGPNLPLLALVVHVSHLLSVLPLLGKR